ERPGADHGHPGGDLPPAARKGRAAGRAAPADAAEHAHHARPGPPPPGRAEPGPAGQRAPGAAAAPGPGAVHDTFREQSGAVKPFARAVALVVGINDYSDDIPALCTPVADATRLADLLEEDHGYTVCRLTQDVTLRRLRGTLTGTLPGLVGTSGQARLLF